MLIEEQNPRFSGGPLESEWMNLCKKKGARSERTP